jgi:hypothetical protein
MWKNGCGSCVAHDRYGHLGRALFHRTFVVTVLVMLARGSIRSEPMERCDNAQPMGCNPQVMGKVQVERGSC